MKYFFAVMACLIFVWGCSQTAGPSGPKGPSGNPAPNSFQAVFQNGVFPTSSYAGEIDTWADGGQQATVLGGNAFRRIKTGSGASAYGRVLLKFDVTSIPVNAQVISAEVQMKTMNTTNIGSNPVTVGVHDLPVSIYTGGCIWSLTATWTEYGSSNVWFSCDGDSSGSQLSFFNNTPLNTVSLTNSINSTSALYAWTIPASTIQTWISGKNNGLVLRSEGEFTESVSSIDFYPYNDATASNHATLLVTYQ